MKAYYNNVYAVVFVYSIDKPSTFSDLQDIHIPNFDSCNTNQNVIKVIVGNKCDLDNERRVTFEELTTFADEQKIVDYFETSAVSPQYRNTVNTVFS